MSIAMPTIEQVVPRGKQAWSIYAADARLNLWVGAVRSGKTYSSLWRWLKYVKDGPPGPLLMIGKTERTLKRNILDPLAEMLGGSRFRLVSGSGECFIFGRRVYLVGASDERAETKIRGMTAAGAYGDEVTTWPESFWNMLLSRLSIKGAQFFGTTNPDSPAHWLKKKFIDRALELGMRVFHFTLSDNPSLDPDYVEALKKEYVGLWYRRYIFGLWALAEGVVYDMFDERRHLVDSFPVSDDGTTLLMRHNAGADYGTGNPTVYLALSEIPDQEQRTWICHDEWRWDSSEMGRQMTDAQYSTAYVKWAADIHASRQLRARWPAATWVDPSAASFRLQLSRDGVPNVKEAENAVLDGIRTVGRLLGNDQLIFHKDTTTETVDEIMGYHWDDNAQQRGEDKPAKVSDHGPDSLRYIVESIDIPPPASAVSDEPNIREVYGADRRRMVRMGMR